MLDRDMKFDEQSYLDANPDVARAVAKGQLKSGHHHYEMHGEQEARPLHNPFRKMTRDEKVMFLLDGEGQGLEIGPSQNPVAPKKKGYNVHALGHLSAEDLRSKYAGHEAQGVNVENIEEVDFVWSGEPLHETTGSADCYDWIIASHVAEHIPNLIAFLQECEKLLKKDGLLSLVIPDNNFCFDYFNAPTSTGQFLDAYSEGRPRPSSGQIFDYFANSCKCDGQIAWGSNELEDQEYSLIHSFEEAKSFWQEVQANENYIDAHCWRFTPASFSLLLSDLSGLGLINMCIWKSFPTEGCEFYLTLGKVSQEPKMEDRISMLSNFRESFAL